MNREVKITCKDGRELFAKGKPFMVSGHEFIAHRSISGRKIDGWQVTCAVTGLRLLAGADTQREAIAAAYALATRIDNRSGPGAFESQMMMAKEGAGVAA